jgi:hypothetical protein
MPVQIINKTFTDLFGNTTSFYKANTGDKTTIELEINEEISVQSGGTNGILEYDPINNIVLWNTGNFLDEGFRIGDTVNFSIYNSIGSVLFTWSTTVTNVTANALDVVSITNWYDYTAGEIVRISVETRKRESLTLLFNHVPNGQQGNQFSNIDGEATIFTFDLNAYVTGATYIGTPVGNKSGQFEITASILDNSDYLSSNDKREYVLTIEIIQSGLYDSALFNFANCLKFYAQFRWSSLANEPFNQYINVFNDDADSGWFDQAFNTGIIDATLLQGITEIDYVNATSGTIIIDSTSSDFAFGCAYVSQDSAYYKNRSYNQSEISMILETREFTIGVPESSALNEFGAGYELTIDAVNVSGTQYTIDYTFTPNNDFGVFMADRNEDDRTMYVWVRFGNVNLLVFDQQAITEPPVGGFLDVVQNIFLDHSENVTDSTETNQGYSANIEDDLAFTGKFLLNNGQQYDSLTAKIVAYNTLTDEDFTLQSVFFDFSTVPFNGTKHLLNFSLPVQTQLPLTSQKRNALCELDANIDTFNQYGIHVYFPFLYRWEYWLDQLNASIDFYPNDQTRNWFPYGSFANWEILLVIEAIKDGLSYVFVDKLTIKNYDSDPNLDQDLQLIIDSSNTTVGVVVENELMRIVATHTLTDGTNWNQNEVWGMITVEPTESSPRYIASSVVPFDYNVNNPLTPLTGLLVPITFPFANVARMECFFDPTKINLANGCKFTSKIKGCTKKATEVEKITTDDIEKITTDDQLKILA